MVADSFVIDSILIESLVILIDCMESTPRVADSKIKQLHKAYSRRIFGEMLDTEKSLGEIRGGTLSFLSEPEAIETVHEKDHDFAWQLSVVSGTFSEFFITGEIPPPHYPWRICVMLRKARCHDLEHRFLAGWIKHFGGLGIGRTYEKLALRYDGLNRRG